MQPFEYVRPATLAEAAALLAAPGRNACALAGGTDLIPLMRSGKIRADLVVDVKDVKELSALSHDQQGRLHIGATLTVHELERSSLIQASFPALARAASTVGSYPVRCRATIGGNVCRASPSGDLLPPLLLYDAVAQVHGPAGPRSLPLADFFRGPGETVLGRGEILVRLVLPPLPSGWRSTFVKYTPRRAMDLAVVGAAAALGPHDHGRPAVRISLGAVAPTPIRALAAERAWLERGPLSWEEVGRLAAAECRPIDDLRAAAGYRSRIVAVLVSRILHHLDSGSGATHR